MTKTYDSYKDSGIAWIGNIPSDWKISMMKYLGEYINGYAFKPTDWQPSGKPIIRIQDLTGSQSNPNYYNEELDTKYLVHKGDILVSWAATLDAFVWNGNEGWLNQHIFKAVPKKSITEIRYFYWLLKVAMSEMNHDNKHGIVMQHVTIGVFNFFKVPLPPISVQLSISTFLDKECGKIDSLISLQEEMITELQAYKQSVITEAVTKGLNPNAQMKDSGVECIGDIPEQWTCNRFKAIANVKANLVHPNDYLDMPQIAPDCIEKNSGKLIKIQTVQEANVISDNHFFYKGQILYSKIRPTLNKVTIAPYDGLCCADMYPIETKLYLKYALFQMLSNTFNSQVAVVVQDRVKMPKINKEELDQILMVVPPLSEQQAIASYLDEKTSQIDALIAIKQEKITELKDYKKSIIYEYVTGKKRV